MSAHFTLLHLDLWEYLLVAVLGVIASIINILAGGGSNLILPVLMIMGVPAAVANGTNRVGIFLQSVVGLRGFHKAGKLPTHDLRGILLPTLSAAKHAGNRAAPRIGRATGQPAKPPALADAA